jgi:pimeloyl-ACP methyl ester carboxylesterase
MTMVLLALLAAGVGVYLWFRSDMRAARARLLAGSRTISTACGPIEVAEEGDGPPVLVVHGTGGGYDQGLNFLHRTLGEGFHRIAISRYGYLRTPPPPDISPAAQAQIPACVLDVLKIPRVGVVGMSAGAHPAAQFALSHPERVAALALIVPALYDPPEPGAAAASGPAGLRRGVCATLRLPCVVDGPPGTGGTVAGYGRAAVSAV